MRDVVGVNALSSVVHDGENRGEVDCQRTQAADLAIKQVKQRGDGKNEQQSHPCWLLPDEKQYRCNRFRQPKHEVEVERVPAMRTMQLLPDELHAIGAQYQAEDHVQQPD